MCAVNTSVMIMGGEGCGELERVPGMKVFKVKQQQDQHTV